MPGATCRLRAATDQAGGGGGASGPHEAGRPEGALGSVRIAGASGRRDGARACRLCRLHDAMWMSLCFAHSTCCYQYFATPTSCFCVLSCLVQRNIFTTDHLCDVCTAVFVLLHVFSFAYVS